ncbi:hypothetical protein EJ08DRAFT_686771 [Tothia fuscella]|uniref:Uncharacterized protein n=1 Tax=Tothia fuscella TaxID=1048955 RepID=A0A9P4U0A0_9PEZI|nr:hypothetical protein EJ08DRAFT_686771 [Tothia fuscella]
MADLSIPFSLPYKRSRELSQTRNKVITNPAGEQLLGCNKNITSPPPSLTPYIQVTRLTSTTPVLLIYLPYLFGILFATVHNRSPILETLHIRTRSRPITRGAVSKKAAFFFAATQTSIALLFFIPFPSRGSALSAIPSIIGAAYYPFAKRHTSFPQFVLGFCLSRGVLVGALALGMRPFTVNITANGLILGQLAVPLLFLAVACTFWTVMYDTIYAYLDLKQDIALNIGSTVVAFPLVTSGRTGELGNAYFLLSVGGAFLSLSCMVAQVDLKQPASCGWWFSNGFKYTGAAIASGFLIEYILVAVCS